MSQTPDLSFPSQNRAHHRPRPFPVEANVVAQTETPLVSARTTPPASTVLESETKETAATMGVEPTTFGSLDCANKLPYHYATHAVPCKPSAAILYMKVSISNLIGPFGVLDFEVITGSVTVGGGVWGVDMKYPTVPSTSSQAFVSNMKSAMSYLTGRGRT